MIDVRWNLANHREALCLTSIIWSGHRRTSDKQYNIRDPRIQPGINVGYHSPNIIYDDCTNYQ